MAAHEIESQTCSISNAAINDVLGGKGSTELIYSDEDNSAVLDFKKEKNGKTTTMFTCDGSMCTKKSDVNGYDTVYDCPELSCVATCEVGSDSACTRTFGNVISNVGKAGVTMACKENGECDMTERLLNLYFGDVAIDNCETSFTSARRSLLGEDILFPDDTDMGMRDGDLFSFMAAHEIESQTCSISNAAINDVLGGKGSTELIYSDEDNSAVLDFKKEKNGKTTTMFTCDGSMCTKKSDVNGYDTVYDCPELSCVATCEVGSDSACTRTFGNVISNVGKAGVTMACKENGECDMTERLLNLYFGDVAIDNCETSFTSARRSLLGEDDILEGDLVGFMAAHEVDMKTCTIGNAAINGALNGKGSTVLVYSDEDKSAVLSFKKENSNGDIIDMYSCEGSTCSKSTGTGGYETSYNCPKLQCSLDCVIGEDSACTRMLGNIIGNVGSQGVGINCNGDQCDVTERMLNLYFGDFSVEDCNDSPPARRNLASYADKVEKYTTKAAKKVNKKEQQVAKKYAKTAGSLSFTNADLETMATTSNERVVDSIEEASDMTCAVANRDVNAVLGGAGSLDFAFSEEESTSILSFKKTVGDSTSDMFECNGSECTKSIDSNGKTVYNCPTVQCDVTCQIGSDPACTNMFANVIGNVGSRGVELSCEGDKCDMTERMLNLYFGAVSVDKCVASTSNRRILKKGGPRATVDDPNWKKQADKWTVDYGKAGGHYYDESPPPYMSRMAENDNYSNEADKGVARAQKAVNDHTRKLRG